MKERPIGTMWAVKVEGDNLVGPSPNWVEPLDSDVAESDLEFDNLTELKENRYKFKSRTRALAVLMDWRASSEEAGVSRKYTLVAILPRKRITSREVRQEVIDAILNWA